MRIGWNLGNALVGLGLIGLGVTLSMPGWSADRVARVESRAEEACRILATLVAESQGTSQLAQAALSDEFRNRCRAVGQPDSDLPELVAEDPVTFGSRHYLFRVVARDLPTKAEEGEAPLEVFAWPRTLLPPGRTAFCFPLDGDAVFTRNLAAGYEGLERAPRAGAALARGENAPRRDGVPYRASNDERWLFLKTPPTD